MSSSSGGRLRRLMKPNKIYESRIYIEDNSSNLYTYEEFTSSGLSTSKVKGLTAVIKSSNETKALCLLKDVYSGSLVDSGMNSMDEYLDVEEGAEQWNNYWDAVYKYRTGRLICPFLRSFLSNMRYGSYSSSLLDLCDNSKWLPSYEEFDVFIEASKIEYNSYGNKILTIWDNTGMLPNTSTYDTTWYPTCHITGSSEEVLPTPEVSGFTLEYESYFTYENDQYPNRISECGGWTKLISRSGINTYNWDELDD